MMRRVRIRSFNRDLLYVLVSLDEGDLSTHVNDPSIHLHPRQGHCLLLEGGGRRKRKRRRSTRERLVVEGGIGLTAPQVSS